MNTGRAEAFASKLHWYSAPLTHFPLDRPPVQFPRYDIYLARAILAAHAGKHPQALKWLRQARSDGQPRTSRVFPPEYVFAEICELLAADSGSREYLDIAVSWAKAYQGKQALGGMELCLRGETRTQPERARESLRDRASSRQRLGRLAEVEPTVIALADQWLARNEPFPRARATARARPS